MKAALERVLGRSRIEARLVEIDVEADPELERRYGGDVPVLVVDGGRAFEHRATERELRGCLERARKR